MAARRAGRIGGARAEGHRLVARGAALLLLLLLRPAIRQRVGRAGDGGRRRARPQAPEVLAEQRARAVESDRVDARVGVGEHEAGDLDAVPHVVVLAERVEEEPQEKHVERQEADDEQRHQPLNQATAIAQVTTRCFVMSAFIFHTMTILATLRRDRK